MIDLGRKILAAWAILALFSGASLAAPAPVLLAQAEDATEIDETDETDEAVEDGQMPALNFKLDLGSKLGSGPEVDIPMNIEVDTDYDFDLDLGVPEKEQEEDGEATGSDADQAVLGHGGYATHAAMTSACTHDAANCTDCDGECATACAGSSAAVQVSGHNHPGARTRPGLALIHRLAGQTIPFEPTPPRILS